METRLRVGRIGGSPMKNLGIFCAAFIAAVGVAAMSADASETVNYTYDARGRLVKVVRTGTVNNNVKAEYKYDDGDNRTNVNVVSPN